MARNGIINGIQEYLTSAGASHPLFIAFDSADDLQALVREFGSSSTMISLSESCSVDDAFPNPDRFFAEIGNSQAPRLLLLGCGEYAELCEDEHFLSRLFDFLCHPKQKIIVPVWNGFEFLESRRSDPRIDDRRVLSFAPTNRTWRLKRIPEAVTVDAVRGFKNILSLLEQGNNGEMTVKTACPLNPKWSRTITSAYELYCTVHPSAHLPAKLFSEKEWNDFLDDSRIQDTQLFSADSFLKLQLNPPDNDSYIRKVLDRTESFPDFHYNLVTSILEVSSADSSFPRLYAEWKEIMGSLSSDDIQMYLAESRKYDGKERLAYLTDNTVQEQLEILSIVATSKVSPASMTAVYPLLNLYAKTYRFAIPDNPDMAKRLTDYFEAYKVQKLSNELSPEFLALMEEVAATRPYNMLPTRGAILEQLKKDNVHLFWLDAMGCEFLGFIQRKASELGLKLTIQIARATLPTLTSVNRAFYEEWDKGTREQSKELDRLKHGEFEDYGYDRSRMPVELAYELNVLNRLLSNIYAHLKARKSQKVVLASDHGATRLAVISGKETLWELPEKGKHGGRCCRVSEFDGVLPDYVAQDENQDWNVMANYSRFKGGRQADVEVHGGASLEEVVVPVIEFELLDTSLKVELLTKEIKATFRDNSIKLVLFCVQRLERVSVEFNGKRYDCTEPTDNPQKHVVDLPKPKYGSYSIAIYECDTYLGTLDFSVQNAGVGIKNDNFF